MRYSKSPLTFEQQADLLLQRGLEADRDQLIRRLQSTNYFRLSGYLYPYREAVGEDFREGTSLEHVWRICLFDQRLRTLLLDAIEAIEVFTRTQLAYHFSHQQGPFDYHKPECLPNLERDQFRLWQQKLETQIKRSLRSKEEFLLHFFDRYGDEHTRPPVWALVELMDFGSMLTFYRGIRNEVRKQIARPLAIPEPVFFSWLLALHTVRNRCAHHLRLWNWKLGTSVKLPKERKYPQWHEGELSNDSIGVIILLLKNLLDQISPQHSWVERIDTLFLEFDLIPTKKMGLPLDWQNHPLWKSS